MMARPTIVWFRQDLRLDDQPALAAAVRESSPILPVFIWSPAEEREWPPGGASRWWLHHSLRALDRELRSRGSRLIVRNGPAAEQLTAIADETGAERVVWCRRYEPAAIERDATLKQLLRQRGLNVGSFNGALLVEPWEVRTKQNAPFQVFTPFWKAISEMAGSEPPFEAPNSISAPERWPKSETIESLELLPSVDWASGLLQTWTPGSVAALERLDEFLSTVGDTYAERRDAPGIDGTSRLSPHLHFGEISPRRIWRSAMRSVSEKWSSVDLLSNGLATFLKELGWREFAHHLLFHFPDTTDRPLRSSFLAFPWVEDRAGLRAWQRGRTGYPIVDAGMRQLWATGWMHNRVRMIAGSFLTKDLRIGWQHGARWFWDTLVDADLANNTLGWQWISGCGADAAPYFRVFNPMLQGAKFDPDGAYVKRWIPELRSLPSKYVHAPWTAPAGVLRSAGITLGETYPKPIVDHAEARQRALEALDRIKGLPPRN